MSLLVRAFGRWRLRIALAVLVGAAVPSFGQTGGKVFLKIQARNPSTEKRTIRVEKDLPLAVTDPDVDIVDKGGMQVVYDAKRQGYRLWADVDVDPGRPVDLSVELRDLWTVPASEIDAIRKHTAQLADDLSTKPCKDDAAALSKTIDESLTLLANHLAAYDVSKVQVSDHIQAYEAALNLLRRAKRDVDALELMAVSQNVDPVVLMGELPPIPEEAQKRTPRGGNPFLLRIEVRNPTPIARTVRVKKYLPPEVTPADVAAPAELGVGYDADKALSYVYSREDVEIAPDKTMAFDVTISNRWVLDGEKMAELLARATNYEAKAEQGFSDAIKTEARQVVKSLTELCKTPLPEQLDEKYIAQYRRQERSLVEIEGRVLRLQKLLTPQKYQKIFKSTLLDVADAPSRQTTWIIIYIVLGFMLLVSILFFLRWYGRPEASPPPGGGAQEPHQ